MEDTAMTYRAAACLALLTPVLALAQPAEPDLARRTLSVAGEGEASAAPDRAWVDFAVSVRDASAGEAAAQAASGMTGLIAALGAEGLAPGDLQTTEIALTPVRRYDDATQRTILEGYEARHALRATVRDLGRLGPVIDAAVAAGATETGGVRFGLADQAAALDAARRAAVADAARTAALLAEAAGVTLGEPLSIRLGGGGGEPRPMMRAMAMEADTPVAPGELTLRATVSVTYAIE